MMLSNYLFFTTSCEAALDFYTRCGLGQVTLLRRYDIDGVQAPNLELSGKVMHARFEGPGVLFHASDNHDVEPMRGSAHMLTMTNRRATDRMFALLSNGGTVTTPLGVQPWGTYFGKLTDRFGVQWMLDCSAGCVTDDLPGGHARGVGPALAR
ncbi:glyoxalase/bleomycin resistance/extradiol dioxygenase family protein [Burkholderia gladioli]|nr:glyoxalase/bleomycin resistance/extradiol dioxygenase family protein [Burkholderia gladioli]MBW5288259.1 glyoxalase/bleomycin resistance/extradiol dioxygenase family protein [Burkholderia gladioli]